jgi:hypothetical protein
MAKADLQEVPPEMRKDEKINASNTAIGRPYVDNRNQCETECQYLQQAGAMTSAKSTRLSPIPRAALLLNLCRV